MTVIILGLGPGDPAHLTRQVWDHLNRTDEVYLRTLRHPTVSALPGHLALHSFDHLYEASSSFDAVYEAIAEQIVALGRRPQGVHYAVPGHPLVGESSVQRILELAADQDAEVRLVDGLSFVEPTLSLLGLDGLAGLQLADATDLAVAHHPLLDTDRPALVGQLYGRRLAGEVKLTLMNGYPEDHPVTLVYAAGTDEARVASVPLFELDRGQHIDHLTTLYVPALPGVASFSALQDTITRLRAPDGCPWDREQTHETLRGNLLEETYEVLASLDANDEEKLCEELGDLLMQIIMHIQIATEAGAFRAADVISHIDAKLKRRHPHVFGDLEAPDTATVLRNWEAIKADEREAAGHGDRSRMGGIPTTLPSLARAQSLGDRAARDGFDWPDLDGVLSKVDEETRELCAARNPEMQAEELGDLLFTLANVARWLGVDAESALRETCDRFTWRYTAMEQAVRAQDRQLAALSPDEKERLWEDAKAPGSLGLGA